METLPFELVLGFAITALPFLLSNAGVRADRVALMSAVVLSANSWGSLLNPILGVGLTRRAYAWLTAESPQPARPPLFGTSGRLTFAR